MARSCYQRGVLSSFHSSARCLVRMSHHHTFSRDSITFQKKAPVTSFNRMFANTVHSLGNPIIAFLLSFCLAAILSFWKAPFRYRGPFCALLKRLQSPRLRCSMAENGPAPSFLWETQLGMERPGPASIHIQPLFDGPASPTTSSMHTISLLPCKTAAPSSSPAPSHIAA